MTGVQTCALPISGLYGGGLVWCGGDGGGGGGSVLHLLKVVTLDMGIGM